MTPGARALAAFPSSVRFWEVAAIASIVSAAAVLRLERLGSIPYGISGDEATTGLEARRILAEGWIGPYSPLAAGQPAGVLYLNALAVRLFGETIVGIRLVAALAGTLTVVGLYVLARRHLGTAVALVSASTLAVSGWHIHFSRFAIPLPVWPLVGVATAAALMEALRRDDIRWWAATGALAALGIYVYDPHGVFLVVLTLFLLVALLRSRRARRRARGAAAFVAALLIVSLPMIHHALSSPGAYLGHARYNSILNKSEWKSLDGAGARISFLGRRYADYWDSLCCNPRVDGVDATGRVPLLPPAMLGFAVVGLALGLWRRRGPLVFLGAALVLAMPVAAVLSEGGTARRGLVALPFIALFGALGIVELVRLAWELHRKTAVAAGAAVAAACIALAYQNLDAYFGELPGSPEESFVFTRPLTDASKFMRSLSPAHRVYFYSHAVSFDYEVRRFLAPEVVGEDRSREFGTRSGFSVEVDGTVPVFVFLDAYKDAVEVVRSRYRGGRTIVGGSPSAPTFVAYVAPVPAA